MFFYPLSPTGMFQSTRPRGARHCTRELSYNARMFHPRARVGRDIMLIWPTARTSFQSTRPRGARPTMDRRSFRAHQVSIHAPAWGATVYRRAPPDVRGNVSIHAPAWGATYDDRTDPDQAEMFQSTRPRGARPRLPCDIVANRVFQSTRPRGARPLSPSDLQTSASFNPRARVGRDYSPAKYSLLASSFNPRARVGARREGQGREGYQEGVSIHAPAWGATANFYGVPGGESVSIHAPAWGATFTQYEKMLMKPLVSIHAPAWGATAIRI